MAGHEVIGGPLAGRRFVSIATTLRAVEDGDPLRQITYTLHKCGDGALRWLAPGLMPWSMPVHYPRGLVREAWDRLEQRAITEGVGLLAIEHTEGPDRDRLVWHGYRAVWP